MELQPFPRLQQECAWTLGVGALEGIGTGHLYPYCCPSVLKEPVWLGGEKASSPTSAPLPLLC